MNKLAGAVLFGALLLPLAATAQQTCTTLSLGSRGASVTAVQKVLYDAYEGFPSPTGYFGPLTQAALKQWQREHKIVSSGTPATTGYGAVGPKTRAAMGLSCATGSTPSTGSGQAASPQTTADKIAALRAQLAQLLALIAQLTGHATSTPPVATTTVPIGGGGGGGGLGGSGTTPVSCTFNSQTVANGASVTAYQSSSVPASQTCVSQQRTCSNGTLSGSYLNSSCAVASTPIPAIPNPMVGFFSLLGVGWYRDYFREVEPFINTVFVHSVEPLTENLVYKIAEISTSGKKLILGSHLLFFTDSGNERLRLTLRSDYRQRFDQLWSTLAPYQKNIVGFYLVDEPFWGNLGPVTAVEDEQLRTAIDEVSTYVHQNAPGRLTMVTFAYPTVERGNFAQLIPSNVDLIGVNCYRAFGDVCSQSQIRRLVSTVMSAAKPHQKLLVTADGWWQRAPTPADDVAMLAQIRTWENVLYPYFVQDKIGAFMPFLYQFDGTTYGIENFANARIELVEYMKRLMTGLFDPLPGSSTVVPRGWLDTASCTSVSGWAQDQDTSDAPLVLHIYIDAPAEPPWSGFVERVTANEYRGDLCGVIGSCNHGFSWTIPNRFRDGQAHTIWIYAIDPSNNGDNPLLTGAPKSFTCNS